MIEVFIENVVPVLVQLTIVVDVKVFTLNNPLVVTSSIETALNDLYSVDNQEFGNTIHFSDVSRAITNVTGVDYILNLTLNGGTVNIDLEMEEFPKINTITVNLI